MKTDLVGLFIDDDAAIRRVFISFVFGRKRSPVALTPLEAEIDADIRKTFPELVIQAYQVETEQGNTTVFIVNHWEAAVRLSKSGRKFDFALVDRSGLHMDGDAAVERLSEASLDLHYNTTDSPIRIPPKIKELVSSGPQKLREKKEYLKTIENFRTMKAARMSEAEAVGAFLAPAEPELADLFTEANGGAGAGTGTGTGVAGGSGEKLPRISNGRGLSAFHVDFQTVGGSQSESEDSVVAIPDAQLRIFDTLSIPSRVLKPAPAPAPACLPSLQGFSLTSFPPASLSSSPPGSVGSAMKRTSPLLQISSKSPLVMASVEGAHALEPSASEPQGMGDSAVLFRTGAPTAGTISSVECPLGSIDRTVRSLQNSNLTSTEIFSAPESAPVALQRVELEPVATLAVVNPPLVHHVPSPGCCLRFLRCFRAATPPVYPAIETALGEANPG